MPAPLTKNNPARMERDETIGQLRLQGKNYQEIVSEVKERLPDVPCSKATVHRVLKDEEIKAILDKGTQELIQAVPDAVKNIKDFLEDEDKSYRYKASKDILEITNIAPGKTQNNIITTIYQQNNNQIVDPVVLKAMAAFIDNDTIIDEAGIE